MASEHEDKINTQVFKVHKLKTRSVTLYPSRAAIVREIENVTIKPGRNEISIIGISTLVDENTIKVEGHGTRALITDLVVEKVLNPLDEENDENALEEEKNPECENLSREICELNEKIEDEQEKSKSCSNQIMFMEQHTTSLSSGRELSTSVMADNLKLYREFRENVYAEYKAAQTSVKKLLDERDKKAREHQRVWRNWQNKTKDEKSRKSAEKRDRPIYVQKITVTIELDSLPKSTESVESYISTGKPARARDDEPPKSKGPSLRISYVTTGARWRPRYDIQLDTTSETALLTYRAEFTNDTGETWTDATVTLSTSQTSFTGLEDKVPWLDSWRMNLRKDGNVAGRAAVQELYSIKEKQMRQERKRKRSTPDRQYHASSPAYTPASPSYSPPPPPAVTSGLFGSGVSAFGAAPPVVSSGGLFGASTAPAQPPGAYRVRARRRRGVFLDVEAEVDEDEDETDNETEEEDDDDTVDFSRKMGLALSKSESYGVTTTYDLPGMRTIPSSRLARRHVIKELTLRHVEFSHVSVPKLRAAAFLKARISNSSTTSLLRGPCGLTVDGSFLGNSTVDRCAPGGTFELSLGIDEDVLVEYRKPVKKVASQGMLSREQVVTYERSISVHNAKRKKIEVLLFDQVPVSEDERLKIALLNPKVREGEAAVHANVKTIGGKDLKIERLLKKGGEIRFVVPLEKGDGVVLPVEYEARFPIGEYISQV